MSNQRVLFFTDRIFWPANDGHKVVLTNYCKGLAEKYGCEVHVLSFLEAGQTKDAATNHPAFIASVKLADKPAKGTIAISLVAALLSGVRGGPIQCALFSSAKVGMQLRDAVKRLKPTHVFIDLPRLSPYLKWIKDLPCKRVLYMEDIFSKRYERQLKSLDVLKKTGGIAGKYSSNFKGGLARLAANPFLQRLVLNSESKRMRRLELNSPEQFDYVVLVSPIEANKLSEDANASNVIAIPLGVDCSYYVSGPVPEPRDNVLSFLGSMRSSANADSLRYIVEEVLPLLDRDVILEVSGNADKELIDEFSNDERVKFLGRVEDTRVALRSTSVFLAPIAYGTGIKTKILEAMAIGVPIVTNSVGNEGIGLVDGDNALVSDDASVLAEDVRYLLDNREFAKKIASAARRRAVEVFDWDISLSNFSRLEFSEVSENAGDA